MKQLFKVEEGGTVYVFDDLSMALEYIRASFEDGMGLPDEGDSCTITVAYVTQDEYDAIPESD